MDQPRLRLVTRRRPHEASRPGALRAPGSAGVLLVSAVLLLAAGAATAVGVDAARHPLEPRETARRALALSLERGTDDSGVREMLLELRTSLGRRPLDSGTRVVYGALLLDLSRRLSDLRAAAHHATRAADLAPVTVPIVRLAVLTLTRTGDEALALARISDMFAYDPGAAAALLAEVEPFLDPALVPLGLADEPGAWYAWAAQLRGTGRLDEAYDWNERTHRRWPDHLPTLRFVVARAVRDEDWNRVAAWLPPERELPGVPEAAPLLAYRARLKAALHDEVGARADIRQAVAQAPGSNLIRILAGDALEALDDPTEARRQWNRALFDIPAGEVATRRDVLTRLARLEDDQGRPAVARRLWGSVLELEPSHPEATRRLRELSAFVR